MRKWEERLALKEHYIALGETKVVLYDDEDWEGKPWEHITRITPGLIRPDDPTYYYAAEAIAFDAEIDGLTFHWWGYVTETSGDAHLDPTKVRELEKRIPDEHFLAFRNAVSALAIVENKVIEEHMKALVTRRRNVREVTSFLIEAEMNRRNAS